MWRSPLLAARSSRVPSASTRPPLRYELKRMAGRFPKPVLPGDALTVRMWVDGDQALFVTETQNGDAVIDQGLCSFVPWRASASSAPGPGPPPAPTPPPPPPCRPAPHGPPAATPETNPAGPAQHSRPPCRPLRSP